MNPKNLLSLITLKYTFTCGNNQLMLQMENDSHRCHVWGEWTRSIYLQIRRLATNTVRTSMHTIHIQRVSNTVSASTQNNNNQFRVYRTIPFANCSRRQSTLLSLFIIGMHIIVGSAWLLLLLQSCPKYIATWIAMEHSISLRAAHTQTLARARPNTFIHYAWRVCATNFQLKTSDSTQLMFSHDSAPARFTLNEWL